MKLKTLVLPVFIGLITMYSCEEIEIPVDTCDFSGPHNATNPYNDLYQEILDENISLGIPGLSVAINTPEYSWWIGCAGMARIEDKVTMEPCHLINSGSIAKTYTATLIMRLYEENKLDINDPIKDYLPKEIVDNVANTDVATIYHLLRHTSGITGEDNNSEKVDEYNDPLADSILMSNIEKDFYGVPSLTDPGETFQYANINYTLLALIVEEVSNMSFSEYFDREVRTPLGLANTVCNSDPGYPDDIQYNVNYYMEPFAGELQNCTDIQFVRSNRTFGASSIYATAYEFALFMQKLLRGNILDSTTIKMMLEDELEMSEYHKYCMGITKFDVDNRISYGHYGHTPGSMGIAMYFPESRITISVITNLGDSYFDSDNTKRFNTHVIPDIVEVTFTGSRD